MSEIVRRAAARITGTGRRTTERSVTFPGTPDHDDEGAEIPVPPGAGLTG